MERTIVPTSEVRAWAKQNGFAVGDRGHLGNDVIAAFNRKHRRKVAQNTNPWTGGNRKQEVPA